MPARRTTLVSLVLLGAALVLPWPAFQASVEAETGVAIQVNAAADRHPIDPRVYGVAWSSAAELSALNAPVNRWGGNTTSRYNWKQNADNRGRDWYFESIPYAATEGGEADSFVDESFQGGAEPMITIPMTGWVAKVGAGRTKLASFSQAKYGPQQDCDWSWYPDAGNGVQTSGVDVTGNDPNDASVPSDPQLQKEWVQHLVSRWGSTASGGVRYYLYDNEPGLWFSTHRDVRPVGVTMAQLRDATIAYGTAIKQADPGAVLVGPEVWGWSGYFYSGSDQQYMGQTGCWSCTPDRDAHGGADLLPWLLDQLRQHEQSTGTRLLDVLTVHYYPQGGEFGSDTSASMQARRNRSTRSLWDPSYVDETWIGDTVRLIPRMKQWVDTYYPGLEIGITEYNWGAEGHINGATAQADVLGIFGREGLDVATFWANPDPSTPLFEAFQMYRNYDGARSTFGDVSVRATVPDPDTLSAFAAERTSDGALTLMAINKATSSALVTVGLSGFTPGGGAQVWRLTSSNAIQHLADVAVTSGTIDVTLPAQSVTLFVVPGSSASPAPSLSIGDVSLDEGNAGSTSATFTVTLSAPSTDTVTVHYATANGAATAGSDYTATLGTLTFNAGQTSRTIAVPVSGDTAIENDETFALNLTSPTGATLADAQALGTIRNDDFPGLSIGDATVTEGDSGITNAVFTASLSAAAPFTVTANYITAHGTATAGSDFTALSGNVTFAPGQVSTTITVQVTGDITGEPNETFFVNLSAAAGAALIDGQGQGTILDDDDGTIYRVGPGRTYTTPQAVAGLLDPGDVVEVDGNATYPGDLTFRRPGTVAQPIVIRGVPVGGKKPVISGGVNTVYFRTDVIGEGADHYVFEGFEVTGGTNRCVFHQSNDLTLRDLVVHDCPNQGILGADWGSGSLLLEHSEIYRCGAGTQAHQIYMAIDEDDYPGGVFRMQHNWVHDGLGGNNVKSRAPRNEIYFNRIEGAYYHELELIGADPSCCAENAAREDSDVVGNLIIKRPPPYGPNADFYATRIGGDGTGQSWGRYRFVNNTFVMGASGVFRIFDGLESVEMHNNVFYRYGGQPVQITRTVEAVWKNGEQISGSRNWVTPGSTNAPSAWTGTLSGTNPGFTDAAGWDFTPASGSSLVGAANSAPASTPGVLFPNPLFPPAFEPPGTPLAFGTPNARPTDGALDIGAYESTSAPPLPQLSINDVSVTEGNSGSTNATFTVSLSASSPQIVTVHWATANGSATAGSDYTAASGTLTFTAGQASKTATVAVAGDTTEELDETFFVDLSSPSGATIADPRGQGTITNDDAAPAGPTLSIADVIVTEGHSGTRLATFIVSLSAPSSSKVTLAYATANGTAKARTDYVGTSGTLTFKPGRTHKSIGVKVKGDRAVEPDEVFFLNLSRPKGATIADPQGQATIVNDDNPPPAVSISDVNLLEGDSGERLAVFTVSLSAPSSWQVTVKFATRNGTARAQGDYVATSGKLVFKVGQTSKAIHVPVKGDTRVEPDETFRVTLSDPTHATFADRQGRATITNDDVATP